jgi:meiotic recombination protein SPO11
MLSTPNDRNGCRKCPVYGLFDYDPDGISIMSNYKYGSSKLAHQSNINCPSMNWIGVKSSDFAEAIVLNETSGLMRLSSRNRRLASGMLSREPFTEDGTEYTWREEVQRMLMLNVKAEIQFLESCHRRLEGWLARASRDFQGENF